jgi:hypothetical protein
MRQVDRISLWLSCAVLLTCACGDKQPPAPAPEPAPAADPHAGHDHDHAAPAAAAEPVALPTLAPNARVFFIEPAQGATITGPLENGSVSVRVKMGAENVAIKPAGPLEAGSGHHHVLVDVAVPQGSVVPKDESHLHFGKGETEALIHLRPGAHKLTLQLADGIHRSYGEALSATIDVTVQAAGSAPATAP